MWFWVNLKFCQQALVVGCQLAENSLYNSNPGDYGWWASVSRKRASIHIRQCTCKFKHNLDT